MNDFDRRGGTARRLLAMALVAAPVTIVATVLFGLLAGPGPAQGAGPQREPLHGHQAQVPPGATLLGPAPASTVLPLVVTLQPRDPTALAAEAQAVSNPASPDYHHFLTPKTFAQRFGPTPATIAQVVAALKNEGLAVGTPSTTDLSIPVSGTVAQVQSAFSTPIDRYRLSSGKTGYDNRAAPQVPTTVAPQIEGIIGLDTLSPPQPTTSLPEANATGPHGGTPLGSPALAPDQPSPASTCSTQIGNVESNYGALDAPELAQAYSFDPLYSSSDYGAGATVALVELAQAGYSMSDINTFATCYDISLSPSQITQVDVDGSTGATGPATVEAELDIETVLSMAPKANIDVYEGEDSLYDVFNKIVSDDTAKIVSASWTNGCEAYVGQSLQNSENTLFQTAAVDGQSVFVASGDQGSEGCNINGAQTAPTGSNPVAQTVDPTTGTLYVANKNSNTVSVDSEGTTSDPSDFGPASSVPAGSGPDAVALDAGKVFVANATSNSLTVIGTSTCNQNITSSCASPTQVASNGHLSGPTALAATGSTLYVANSSNVAVYNATNNGFVASVTLPSGTSATSLAVDPANGMVYLSDGSHNRVEYFSGSACNAGNGSGCPTITPGTVPVGTDPVSLVVDDAAGSLYVANAGTGGGVSVVSLSNQTVLTTIATGNGAPGLYGNATVSSVALSPGGTEVFAGLAGLTFPGDVLATINPATQAITATVSLEIGSDTIGAIASDSTRDLVWVTDRTAPYDVVQNLNLAVSDPASQPYVTSVGGTSVTALGPVPTESTWNDRLHFAEGAGGGGISKTFAMPSFQKALGTVAGSSGTPCAASSGDCREVPDVSGDADPSTGYVVYDAFNNVNPNSTYMNWTAIGGTSGAAPLWAAVLAVAASADGNTTGYGAMNPILYGLAQQSPGTYLNDVTSGNNDYNATNGGQFAAATGYDMATGLGTPVTSSLATGLMAIPLDVAVTGTQVYGGTPTFGATVSVGGQVGAPYGVTVSTAGITCTEVGTSTPITSTLAVASDTLLPSSCSGVTLGGANKADYTLVYTSASGDFNVTPAPVDVAVSGSQTFGGSPTFNWSATSPPAGITVSAPTLSCSEVTIATPITPSLAAGSHTLVAAQCTGASLSGTNSSDYAVVYTSTVGNFPVSPAPLTVTASGGTLTYGGTVPTITPGYSGFVAGNTPASLTTLPTCSTNATSSSTVGSSPYTSSCTGAVDANYAIGYVGGTVTVTQALLTVTASSGTMTYGGTVPTITAGYTGFKNGDTASSLTPPPACSTTATSSSTVAGSPYTSTCTGASDPNYAVSYVAGTVTVTPAPLSVTASGGTMTYGGMPPSIIPNYSGFVNGDGPSSLTTGATCSTTATSSSTVVGSPYQSSCSGVSDPNYAITYHAGSVSVGKAPLSVTASGSTMTYGGSPPAITANYAGFVNGDSKSSLSPAATCSTTATGSSPASPPAYASSCSGAVDTNYSFSYVGGTVTVTQAPLTVTASGGTMTYGGTPPAITANYGGFKNGETASALTTKPTCSTLATSSSPVGSSPYTSSCSGAVDPNYTIGYVAGSVTVAQAPLTVTAIGGSMTYGGTPPTITANYSGFVNGDSMASLTPAATCSTTATVSSPASPPSYPSSCMGAADPNYAISYVAGSVTVGKAPLTVTASSGTMSYGGTPPSITPGYAGFVNGDTLLSLTTTATCGSGATSSSPVAGSPYASTCTGAGDSNYAFTYVPGSVTVTQAPLTVTASSGSMTYGGTPPPITAGYGGFKNGETASALTTKPTCSTAATSSSPVAGSPYTSTCSGALDPNYAIGYVAGSVTVAQAPLIITASSGTMTYGGAPPAITSVYGGFKNGDSMSSLTPQPTCSTTATGTSTPSPPTYSSTCSGAADPNYAISYVAGSVTVDKAPLTVTASSGTMSYGGTPPAISSSYSGFVNGDSSSSLTTGATCSTAATGSSGVAGSPYASTCTGVVDPDYAFNYVAGSVTVTKVPLTVTASSGTMTYGGLAPAITPAYGGFVNGDTAASLTTKPTCSTTATSASTVAGSPYGSSCTGTGDPNYTFGYVPGSVTVTQAPLMVTASSGSMTYGSAPPAVTPLYTGFKNGQGASVLAAPPTCTPTATSTSTPSPPTYPTSCPGAAAANYAITYVNGATTVMPAPVDVAVSGSQAFGGSPGFSATPPSPLPSGVTVDTSGVSCGQVAPSTHIGPSLAGGSYSLVGSSCSGATLSDTDPDTDVADFTVVYTTASGDFTVTGGSPPPASPPAPAPAQHGYWLVGSDGGIFTFGSAHFYGSTGSLVLQRPVVGITPTADEGGYWLVATDGGIFAFGNAGFYGSIPGLGLSPAGSGAPRALNAPIVGMVPSADGGGYFMVASDGGVFAFGDAQFEGSCPGIGGCGGAAVAVVPDATGRGYWLVTQTGGIYTFGDAPFYGAPGPQGSPITAAVRTADGRGYYVLLANGTVFAYGDAVPRGGPTGAVGGLDPASAIFTDAGGGGYWVASAGGAVFTYGDAPNDGSMAGARLNGLIIAGTGF